MRLTSKKTGMTVTAFLATAFIIGGCSTDSRLTAPGAEESPDMAKGQQFATPVTASANNLNKIALADDNADSEEISIIAKVDQIDVEGGCFVLVTAEGENYTPIVPRGLKLTRGMILKAKGYIDRDVYLFCGNGPAFVIKKYEVIDDGQTYPVEDKAVKGTITDNGSSEDRPEYRRTEERFPDQGNTDQDQAFKKKVEEENAKKASSEDRRIKTRDDNDNNERYPEMTEDRYMNSRNTMEEDKKKIEEENNPKDYNDPEDRKPANVVDPQVTTEIQPS
jgi:hypothetical protein